MCPCSLHLCRSCCYCYLIPHQASHTCLFAGQHTTTSQQTQSPRARPSSLRLSISLHFEHASRILLSRAVGLEGEGRLCLFVATMRDLPCGLPSSVPFLLWLLEFSPRLCSSPRPWPSIPRRRRSSPVGLAALFYCISWFSFTEDTTSSGRSRHLDIERALKSSCASLAFSI